MNKYKIQYDNVVSIFKKLNGGTMLYDYLGSYAKNLVPYYLPDISRYATLPEQVITPRTNPDPEGNDPTKHYKLAMQRKGYPVNDKPLSPVDPIGEFVVANAALKIPTQLALKTFNYIPKVYKNLQINKVLSDNINKFDGTVGEEYFKAPDKWYRITETPEVHGIREVGKNVTTRDAADMLVPSNSWRSSIIDNGIKPEVDNGWKVKEPEHGFNINLTKNGSAHGNKSLAAKGLLWLGTTSGSHKFPKVVLEGQAPTQINASYNPLTKVVLGRSSFKLLNWEGVPIGNRVGFNSGEMPLSNLTAFLKLKNGRYSFEPVLPDKRIYVEPKLTTEETGKPLVIPIFKKLKGGNVPYYLEKQNPHHTVWQIATLIGRMHNKPNILNRMEGGALYGLKNYITNYNDPSQITSFKMSYGERDGKNYAFPLVQLINGKLVDFEDPKNGGELAGMKSAFKRKDIIPMSSEADADYFTNNNYKVAYPNVIRPDFFNAKKYLKGGTLSKNILNLAKYLMNMPKALGTSGALSFYGEDTRFTPHVTLQDDLNKNNYDGDLKNYSYSLPKDIVITGTSPMYLETQEPFTDGYPIGHSSVSVDTYNNNGGGNIYEESKLMSDNGYNLLTNNCSDGTRQVLEYTFNKKINPFLFTTPGDVRDFAIDSLLARPLSKYPNTLVIPVNIKLKRRAIHQITKLNNVELKYEDGGTLPTYDNSKYYPSLNIINLINKWEGDSMRTNNPISTEFNTFINQFPKDTLNKLKPNLLDALFSYNYNRPKAFRTRALPYIQLLSTAQDQNTYNNIINLIANSFAVKSRLRGLIKRSNTEKQIFSTP